MLTKPDAKLMSEHLKNYVLEMYKLMLGHLQTLTPEEYVIYVNELKFMINSFETAHDH